MFGEGERVQGDELVEKDAKNSLRPHRTKPFQPNFKKGERQSRGKDWVETTGVLFSFGPGKKSVPPQGAWRGEKVLLRDRIEAFYITQ